MNTERGVVELWDPKSLMEPAKTFTFDAVYDTE